MSDEYTDAGVLCEYANEQVSKSLSSRPERSVSEIRPQGIWTIYGMCKTLSNWDLVCGEQVGSLATCSASLNPLTARTENFKSSIKAMGSLGTGLRRCENLPFRYSRVAMMNSLHLYDASSNSLQPSLVVTSRLQL